MKDKELKERNRITLRMYLEIKFMIWTSILAYHIGCNGIEWLIKLLE